MDSVKNKSVFIQGAISSERIANTTVKHHSKKGIGGYKKNLEQVSADEIDGKPEQAIDYSPHNSMAEKIFDQIKSAAFKQYDLIEIYIYHSIGLVKSEEIYLFAMVFTWHRDESYAASRNVVEEIKTKVPIFGKELFEDNSYVWKQNR